MTGNSRAHPKIESLDLDWWLSKTRRFRPRIAKDNGRLSKRLATAAVRETMKNNTCLFTLARKSVRCISIRHETTQSSTERSLTDLLYDDNAHAILNPAFRFPVFHPSFIPFHFTSYATALSWRTYPKHEKSNSPNPLTVRPSSKVLQLERYKINVPIENDAVRANLATPRSSFSDDSRLTCCVNFMASFPFHSSRPMKLEIASYAFFEISSLISGAWQMLFLTVNVRWFTSRNKKSPSFYVPRNLTSRLTNL